MLTIQRWVRKYGKQGLRTEVVHIQKAEEADRVRELEKQVKELEQALGKMVIKKLKLESILEELQETEGDVVKKTNRHPATVLLESPARALQSEHDPTLCPIRDQPPSALSEAVARDRTPV